MLDESVIIIFFPYSILLSILTQAEIIWYGKSVC